MIRSSISRFGGRLALSLVCALGLAAPAVHAQAGDWPKDRPIRLLVGYAAGGAADMLSRLMAQKLGEKAGQSVVVENRAGAAGMLALQVAAKSPPDGYTVVYMTGPVLYGANAPVMGKDLRPVAMIANGPLVLVGPASIPASNLKELIPLMRKDPGAWSYATSGRGSTQHLAGVLMASKLGVPLQDVPYKGGSQAVIDVVSGVVPLAILGTQPAMPYIQSGKLKAFGVTTSKRFDALLPNVATFDEQGIKGYDAGSWSAIGVPAGVPDAIVERLHGWIDEVIASEEWKRALRTGGQIEAGRGTAKQAQDFIITSQREWDALAHAAHIDID